MSQKNNFILSSADIVTMLNPNSLHLVAILTAHLSSVGRKRNVVDHYGQHALFAVGSRIDRTHLNDRTEMNSDSHTIVPKENVEIVYC